MSEIPTDKITLSWTCSKCKDITDQPLIDIATVGAASCTKCGWDMELNNFVQVAIDPIIIIVSDGVVQDVSADGYHIPLDWDNLQCKEGHCLLDELCWNCRKVGGAS